MLSCGQRVVNSTTLRLPPVPADLEHLKLIQSVISRMAANSFVLKGWAVTLVTGLAALAKADGNDDIAWISLGVLFVFAMLDGYYLALERSFRDLYRDTVEGKAIPLYSLKPSE